MKKLLIIIPLLFISCNSKKKLIDNVETTKTEVSKSIVDSSIHNDIKKTNFTKIDLKDYSKTIEIELELSSIDKQKPIVYIKGKDTLKIENASVVLKQIDRSAESFKTRVDSISDIDNTVVNVKKNAENKIEENTTREFSFKDVKSYWYIPFILLILLLILVYRLLKKYSIL